ncbi:MAG: 3-keto-5-aminohexanoate cleavage protein [Antarcticimicrobium sp.]|uniref:3-keto-5-aminohexanoate cleavage protein n=1 Tax=Antarcticimicrobium sp. TaxID=2824147 RepID=UPI0026246001|nr:3-keto-5-aminohexanoate cleavage protein [Antarcticimicrobium sp.]MDF1716639.1 3-keto-5-aminohexanoate cleavage protein [Antarcticimicrobium sp.]
MTRPLIMVAPNGARRGKADHPALPVTIPEIVETARACHAAGADALHLHVRDDAGCHSLDPGRYTEALAELSRAVPGMRVQITTESAGIFDAEDQFACLTRLKPRWASISLREIARDAALAPRVYASCADNGTEVQHILYDAEDAALLARWQAQGIVRPGQDSTILVLGRYATGQVATPGDLAPLLAAKPPGCWMLCAFGPAEHACLLEAARHGGDLRVGFENNLHRADCTLLRDNAESVARLVAQLERTPA